jgi:transforming growth factor-beta-induced protein
MKTIRILMALPLAIAMAACSENATVPAAVVVTPEAGLDSRGAPQQRAAAASPTLVDVALSVNAETGEFSTLIAAVVAAGLVDELSARGQRTVFAPTDAAFAELGLDAAGVAALPVEALTEILLYHVAPGRRYAASVVTADRIRMANGGFTTIRVVDGVAYIDDAAIVATDVEATNGIIHVIDAVLMP